MQTHWEVIHTERLLPSRLRCGVEFPQPIGEHIFWEQESKFLVSSGCISMPEFVLKDVRTKIEIVTGFSQSLFIR